MKELNGSEKQIAWAEDIRKTYIDEIEYEKKENVIGKTENFSNENIYHMDYIKAIARKMLGAEDVDQLKKEAGMTLTYQEVENLPEDEARNYRVSLRVALRSARAKRYEEAMKLAEKAVENEESAKWWINHRI